MIDRIAGVLVVTVNGSHVGVRLSPPYRFNVTDFVTEDENLISIDVINTVVKAVPDRISAVVAQDATGMLGPVRLMQYA